ncbi:PREDICTED: uncharacterized protein LOC109478070 [Branchiostoma belcheri]|uniref:Uncharacterized protein LOC109478070 n=1 Tax=Branchiostoma belcheri TaxID=7741 RepID=A0A6P4ZM48_BRABE|nr:PREDICTED: uncharacterized protein LOC109478070 [Branchiostoma belcheri]
MRPSTLVLVLLVMATTTCLAQSAMHNHIFPWYEFKRAAAGRGRRPAAGDDFDVMLPMDGTTSQNEDETEGDPVEGAVPYGVDRDALPVDVQTLQDRLARMYVCFNQKTGKWRFCRGDPSKAENRVRW